MRTILKKKMNFLRSLNSVHKHWECVETFKLDSLNMHGIHFDWMEINFRAGWPIQRMKKTNTEHKQNARNFSITYYFILNAVE